MFPNLNTKKSIMELMKQSKSKSKLIKSIIISWRKAKMKVRAYVAEFHSANTHARLHCLKLEAIDTIARSFTRSPHWIHYKFIFFWLYLGWLFFRKCDCMQ